MMYTPAAADAGVTVVEKDVTLSSAYSPVDYMSITSFPRLPEDDALSSDNTLKSRKDDDNFLSEQDTGACILSYIYIYSVFLGQNWSMVVAT